MAPNRPSPPPKTYNPTPPALASASRIYELIMRAAERQIATSSLARQILASGNEHALRALVAQIAANAANPIADLLEDAIGD